MPTKESKYLFEVVGRRKTAVARVRLSKSAKTSVIINDRPIDNYFTVASWKQEALAPLTESGLKDNFAVTIKIIGGGVSSQAGAVRQGLARAILKLEPELKPTLKKHRWLTRDAREKERRKFGLKKARKAPQWSKR